MTKVWICYMSHGYEGKSEPLVVYDNREMAHAWLAGNSASYGNNGMV